MGGSLRWCVALVFCAGVVALPGGLRGQEGAPQAPAPEVDLQWGVKVPMRDGVLLNATVVRPHGQKEPVPVVFTLTPYIADSYLDRAMYFAQHGYVYALVDVRGRGNSEGSFAPFENDAKDGHDLVEWFAKQPWCDGKVAMWGGSYAGFDQWATLKEFPPHLATIVPAAAAHAGVDFPYDSNIAGPYLMQWLSFTSGVTSNAKLFGEQEYWHSKWLEMYRGHIPFNQLDTLVGNPSAIFHKWLAHSVPDAYFDGMAPTEQDYRRIAIPILTITGAYDGDQHGAMTYYRRHMQNGSAEARNRHYLVIGPWDHAGTRTPNREVGGLKFGEASMVDLNKLHLEWYDWTMKKGARPKFLEKRVMYYVMGEEKWKAADALESVSNDDLKWSVDSAGDANDVFHSGVLTTTVRTGTADHFTYDPLDVRPGESEVFSDPNSLTSQRGVMNLLGRGVVYQSAPLERDTEVSGYPKFHVWLTMDVPDTDLLVNIYEIRDDGSAVALSGAAMRARYRKSLRKPEPVPANQPELYTFDEDFSWFSRRLQKGSRIRLVLECPNSIELEKNYNSGGDVAAESAKDARTAHITVLHDKEHASELELPVVK